MFTKQRSIYRRNANYSLRVLKGFSCSKAPEGLMILSFQETIFFIATIVWW